MDTYIGVRLGYRAAKDGEARCTECAKCAQRPDTREFYCHHPVKGRWPWATSEAWQSDTATSQQISPRKRCDLFERKGA